jgi:hypothetical protein
MGSAEQANYIKFNMVCLVFAMAMLKSLSPRVGQTALHTLTH